MNGCSPARFSHDLLFTTQSQLLGYLNVARHRLLRAALDRLRHNAYRVVLDGESYRAHRPLLRSTQSPVTKTTKPSNP
jgi:hypothetical protein